MAEFRREMAEQRRETASRMEAMEKKIGETTRAARAVAGAAEKVSAATRPPAPTFAERVKAGIGKTVVVKGHEGDAEKIKASIREAVKPSEEGIKITGVRKGKQGVVLSMADEGSWTKVVNSKALSEKGLKVETPQKRQPRLGIYGMERGIEKEELVNMVHQQNFKDKIEPRQFKEEFVPLFRTGRRDNPRGAWIVRVSPRVRSRLLEAGRVYVGWDSCRVEDEPGVTRCFRCRGYGHLAARCTAKPQSGQDK